MYFPGTKPTATMPYQPGTHIIATIQTGSPQQLLRFTEFRDFLNDQIQHFSLRKLGEVYHDFSPHGFTGVVCLSESHISIHTWPEHKLINLDIYLSNFERNNDGTVEALYKNFISFFSANEKQVHRITR